MICLELGPGIGSTVGTSKRDYYNSIYYALRDIVDNRKHYLVSIYDTVSNAFMGDAEVIEEKTGNICIVSLRNVLTKVIGKITYSFNADYYKREYAELVTIGVDDYNNMQNRISALEQKLNEITITK